MDRKIYDERGFLTAEGKAFVNDGFVKEAKRVLSTGDSSGDILVIASILKSIVAELACDCSRDLITPRKPDLKLIICNKEEQNISEARGSKPIKDLIRLLKEFPDEAPKQ